MQESQDKIVVAYVCDQRYLPFMLKSMESVRRHNPSVEFAVLTSDTFRLHSFKTYPIPYMDIRKYFVKNSRMREGVFYKFFLPILPFDKVIYIDCDVYCQHSLKDLWNIPCPYILATESHAYGNEQAAALGLDRYAITSMMVMNLKALREISFTDKCMDRFKKNPKVKFHDETIINQEFNDKMTFIDKKYNYCHNRKYAYPILEKDAVLLHYVGYMSEKRAMLLRRD